MRFKAIIFDLDGTVIDTTRLWSDAAKKLIANLGITVDHSLRQELHNKVHGLSIYDVCEILKDNLLLTESVSNLVSKLSSNACQLYENRLCFIEGFEKFYDSISSLKIKMAIATNADLETLSITKKLLCLEDFFGPHIYDISHVNNVGKPDPAIYLYAIKKLSLLPHECVAIEDSYHGIKAAKNAGLTCIGINTGGNQELLKDADHIIQGYHEFNMKLFNRSRILKKIN